MFILSEVFPAPIAPHKLGEFATAADACAKARELGAVFLEEDEDNPDHFDAFTKGGAILTIEPIG
ncbi:MAG: hypothetical protein ACLPTZ_13575 [Beijerinckiaceae bacterium]